ncbi:FAD:protein FMN transferase [Noviherbaspirillum sp.]|jgi:thiamine biosynthesis lipoprotein|uniref:FAD:protein FMN transferase n=1 Tax=Noviherbaspirillum sp. TaxID=1926288 RepID=UPI0025CF8D49|nr:FAD:protein FMN transferase [Noviherbaspirillum sp.]
MSRWRTLRFDFQSMASPCSLQMDGQDERAMRRAATDAIAEVRRIEEKFSRYRETSVISRINRAAGAQAVDVDAETAGLLDFAQQLWMLSDGLFDITSGVLRRAWDFRKGRLPEPAALDALMPLVGWQHVERDGNKLRLSLSGMELDFGGFGKEYAVDCAAAVLQGHGIAHALVNLGGDLYALGARGLPEHEGEPWLVEIQHPRPDPARPAAPLALLPLARGGLTTSGDYERFFMHEGQRYCHILNPHTGWPVSHWQSVSILAANATTAGALSTIAMLKGPEAIGWLQTQNVRYLAVQHDGQVVRNGTADIGDQLRQQA